MAVYPTGLPTDVDIPDAGANLSTNPHSALHDDLRDETVAICAELGVSPSGSFATVKARLDSIQAGTVSVDMTGSGGSVTFPSPYTSTPVVVVSVRRNNAFRRTIKIVTVTTTGFTFQVWDSSDVEQTSGTEVITYFAMPPT